MVNEILNTENNIPKTQALLNENIDSLISKSKKNIISVQWEWENNTYIEKLKNAHYFYAGKYENKLLFWSSWKKDSKDLWYYDIDWNLFLNAGHIKTLETEDLDYKEALPLFWITELENWDFVINKEKRVIQKEDKEYFETIIEIQRLNAISMIENSTTSDTYNIPIFKNEEMVPSNKEFLDYIKKDFRLEKLYNSNSILALKTIKRGQKIYMKKRYDFINTSLRLNKYKVYTFSKLAIDVDRWYIPDEKVFKSILQKINNYYVDLSTKDFKKYGHIVDMKDIELARKRGWIRKDVYNQVKVNIESRKK